MMYDISEFFYDFLNNILSFFVEAFSLLDDIKLSSRFSLLDFSLVCLLLSVLITLFVPIISNEVAINAKKDTRPDSVRNDRNNSND